MIAEYIKRFILTSIDSIPHLEAILLLRYDQEILWDVKSLAQKLYINKRIAQQILDDLYDSHFVKKDPNCSYQYAPDSLELKNIIDELADVYAKNLIEVTNLIHSKTDKQAQQFGDAFKWDPKKDN